MQLRLESRAHRQPLLLGVRLGVWLYSRLLSDLSCGIRGGNAIVIPPKVGRHAGSHQSSQLNYHADDGAVHAFEVENASAFPKRLENHTLGKSSRALGPRTMTSQPITDPPERALGSSNPFQQGSPDSLLLGLGLPSSSGPPQTIENNDIPHSPPPPTYLPAPLSPDLFPVPLSPRPPPYFTVDMARRQSNLPEFDPSMTQNVVGRSLTDSDVEAIARRVTEMQRDQRR